MSNDPKGATGEAMRLAKFAASHPDEDKLIRRLPDKLTVIMAASCRAIRHALYDVSNTPNVAGTLIHSWIARECDRIGEIEELAIREMEKRPETGEDWSEERIRTLAVYDLEEAGADIGETLAKLQAMLAKHEAAA